MIVQMITMLILAAPGNTDQRAFRQFLDALRQVETGGHVDPGNALGDQGRSLGPYQITYKYWRDSGVPGDYSQVRNRAYAERVMVAYWKRHCPQALRTRNWQILARVHNGGPKGLGMTKTRLYWRKVLDELGGK